MKLSKQSFLILLVVIIIFVVTVIMAVQATHKYFETKKNIVDQMHYDANYLGSLLQKIFPA